MMPALLQVRQNCHPGCEAGINGQVNLQIYASYVYMSMAFYFDRDDVALKRFSHFFLCCSHKHKEQIQGLMHLQNRHGGRFCLPDLRQPDRTNWQSGLQAMQCTLHLEKSVNQSLLNLNQLATDKNDPHLCHFLKTQHLDQQVEFIKELGGHISNLHKMGAPEVSMAEYLFDKLTLGDGDKEA
uniref:Ferritin n=1 Tax=Moschus moschiferus TaxID=68415 RepID=A0A8C6DTG2_MOSMO